jgi:hypothetical protein
LSFVELAAGHRYIREDGRRKCQPRRKVPFLHDLQRNARGRIRLPRNSTGADADLAIRRRL